jgi:hypothetical protein
MLCPFGARVKQLSMHDLRIFNLAKVQRAFDHDDKVDIAVLIEIAYGKGSLKIDT